MGDAGARSALRYKLIGLKDGGAHARPRPTSQ